MTQKEPTEALLHPLSCPGIEPPRQLNNPFSYEPHPLCLAAAEELKRVVRADAALLAAAEEGEMFGVLVVKQASDDAAPTAGSASSADAVNPNRPPLYFLAAYAGLLAGRNDHPWFVPPVFDAQQPDGRFKTEEARISRLNAEISALEDKLRSNPDEAVRAAIDDLRRRRKEQSNNLLNWLYTQYNIADCRGNVRNIVDIWRDYHRSPALLKKFPLPPGGTGECCAPKLLHYAFTHRLQPIAIAEFWWGRSPKGEIRHHGQFYPACNGKCKPLLTWMLHPRSPFVGSGVADESPWKKRTPYVQTLFDDPSLAVVVKPAKLLSVDGTSGDVSLAAIMHSRNPQSPMPMMVHRLDMDTSGVMVVAKTAEAYRRLRLQFERREVRKQYVALIESVAAEPTSSLTEPSAEPEETLRPGLCGTISLPLRPDFLDRPRQLTDPLNGKPAVTDYEILSREGRYFRVLLTPHTGRTHQLRVHCASPDGLNHPIVGDNLYGRPSDRLYLHALSLTFRHPLTGETLTFRRDPDF